MVLYYLQAFYSNEVQRGFAGLGNFKLSSEFDGARRAAEEIITISTFQPEEIVARIQERSLNTDASSENSPPTDIASAPSSTQSSRARLLSL